MPFRNELKLCLGALPPAFAEYAARTNGDGRLNNVEAFAQGIRLRVEQGHDTVTLVVV